MDTLIIYSTKYGASKKSAEYLNEKLQKSIIIDLAENVPNIENFKNIIVGTSVYIGKIRKSTKYFLEENRKILKDKNLYIYVNAAILGGFVAMISENLPDGIEKTAKDIVFAGCEIDEKKLNFFDGLIYKIARSKMHGAAKEIDYKALDKIIDSIKGEKA